MSVSTEYTTTRNYIKRFAVMEEDALDIVTTWTMHTWLFSPACENPLTTPYLYITAEKGSGKTLLGQDVLGTITRSPMNTVGITGPSLIRLVGGADFTEEEEGTPVTVMPTLTIDEVDALYSGAKDEVLRMMLNAGYRRGGTVPRVVGREVINYSAFCPKILMGIDNGHLPDTVTDRSIRITLKRATAEQMATVEPFYHFDVEDEAAEICSDLAEWAKTHSLQIRQYRPEAIPGLTPRQWEIARTLVQVAKFVGNEKRIREAIAATFAETPTTQDPRVSLYAAIREAFGSRDRITTNEILQALTDAGVSVPGQNGKGLGSVIGRDGIKGSAIRLSADDVQRGYYRYSFDAAFAKYLGEED